MTISGKGWGSNANPDFTSTPPRTTGDSELNQRGKVGKAVIGLAILMAIALTLAWIHPARHDGATVPSVSGDSSQPGLNRAPGPTTGQAPSAPAN